MTGNGGTKYEQFDDLIERYRKLIRKLCWRHSSGSQSQCDELVQDCYISIWCHLPSLRLDVTVLEVTDSAVWEQTCEELHLLTTAQIPAEFRHLYFTPNNFESYIVKDTVEHRQTVFIYTRYNRTICIFHNVTDEQYDAIMAKNIDEI